MSKSIVVFYTWSSQTRKLAEMIARQTGADIEVIVPQLPYSQNYNTVVELAKKEIRSSFLPAINAIKHDLNEYDVVFVGTPNWWSTMAPPVATFLSENTLDNKIIMPFLSHGGGGTGHILKDVLNLCPNSSVKEIFAVYEGGATEKEIKEWLWKNEIKTN